MLLIRMAGETSQHAGHADIVRELIDGRTSDPVARDPQYEVVQAVADRFRSAET